jgi:hypothetical protein
MGVELLTERYKGQIAGVLSCYDRIIIQGTVPGWCYARGMTDYFYQHQIRIFDYPKWAEPLRDALRENMERVAVAPATLRISMCAGGPVREVGRRTPVAGECRRL